MDIFKASGKFIGVNEIDYNVVRKGFEMFFADDEQYEELQAIYNECFNLFTAERIFLSGEYFIVECDDRYKVILLERIVKIPNMKKQFNILGYTDLQVEAIKEVLSGIAKLDSNEYEVTDFLSSDSGQDIVDVFNSPCMRFEVNPLEEYGVDVLNLDIFKEIKKYNVAKCNIEEIISALIKHYKCKYTKKNIYKFEVEYSTIGIFEIKGITQEDALKKLKVDINILLEQSNLNPRLKVNNETIKINNI